MDVHMTTTVVDCDDLAEALNDAEDLLCRGPRSDAEFEAIKVKLGEALNLRHRDLHDQPEHPFCRRYAELMARRKQLMHEERRRRHAQMTAEARWAWVAYVRREQRRVGRLRRDCFVASASRRHERTRPTRVSRARTMHRAAPSRRATKVSSGRSGDPPQPGDDDPPPSRPLAGAGLARSGNSVRWPR